MLKIGRENMRQSMNLSRCTAFKTILRNLPGGLAQPSSGLPFAGYLTVAIISASLFATSPTQAATGRDLTSLSIQELMNVKVTSAGKKPQNLSDVAGAIYVITQEDIRRSTASSIPELLRDVPGLHVARIDTNKWAISARGFSGRFANKILVLVDGRTVYSPLFSGVFWEVQDTFLPDIDRIEIIRGPGASVWGSNAVNGVINIITKNAKDTLGAMAVAEIGTEERGIGSFRYGGKISEDAYLRIFGKHLKYDSARSVGGGDGHDEWDNDRLGFRLDNQFDDGSELMLQGEAYVGSADERADRPTLIAPFTQTTETTSDLNGQFILGRWAREFSDTSNVSFQGFIDRSDRDDPRIQITTTTFDIEGQHTFNISDTNEFNWGLGYRYETDSTNGSFDLSLIPDDADSEIFSAFLQDEQRLLDDDLSITVGAKFEHNNYSGFEAQPSARALYRVNENNSVWISASRALHTPTRGENEISLNQQVIAPFTGTNLSPFPLVVRLTGIEPVPEEVYAFELGYRTVPAPEISVDIAAFYNVYNNLSLITLGGSPFFETTNGVLHLVNPLAGVPGRDAEAFGLEFDARWQVSDRLTVRGAYSFLKLDMHADSRAIDAANAEEGQYPQQQLSLITQFDITDDIALDTVVRFVDTLPNIGVDGYVTGDLRLGWQISDGVEVSLIGRNLIETSHQEFVPELLGTRPTEVERSVLARFRVSF